MPPGILEQSFEGGPGVFGLGPGGFFVGVVVGEGGSHFLLNGF